MAFALLANLPPVNGLYSSFFPLVPYFFLGGIHQMVPGEELSAQGSSVLAGNAAVGCLLCQGSVGWLVLAALQDVTPMTLWGWGWAE